MFITRILYEIIIYRIDLSFGNFNIYSNKISIKGGFNELIKTIYAFETEFNFARIATMKFYVLKNRKTRKKELYNDIIFQNYEKK